MSSACSDDDECCPISPEPQCSNFLLGGAKSLQGGSCGEGDTDDIPEVKKSTDSKGCPVWVPTGGPVGCGLPFDAGRDASNADVFVPDARTPEDASAPEEDASDDASDDAAGD